MVEHEGLPMKPADLKTPEIKQNFSLGKQIGPWKTKREKRRSRRRRYTVAAVVAVLLAIGLYEYLPPLFATPNP